MADSSLKGLMKDKRVQLAAAGVGGVGLVVMLMRRGGGAGAGGTVTQIQPAAGLDTSNSDLYASMQQLGQGWTQDMRDLMAQQKNVLDQLPKTPTTGTGAQPAPAPKPAPLSPSPGWLHPGATYTSKGGDTWQGIAQWYGRSVQEMQRANPGRNPGAAGSSIVVPPVYRDF